MLDNNVSTIGKNLNQRWRAKDIKKMRELINEGKSSSEIAEVLGRSRASVWTKKSELKIRKRIASKRATLPVSFSVKSGVKTEKKSKNDILENSTLGQQIDAAIRNAKAHGISLKISLSTEN